MTTNKNLEVWLRGALPDIPSLLQPVAHALLQAREEVEVYVAEFPEDLLWERPANLASVGFHLQHLTGVLDRLFTYAKGEQLTQHQLDYLTLEGKQREELKIPELLANFQQQITYSIEQLHQTKEDSLTEQRVVGRAEIPSTVIGLLVHAAEHTQRHVGQLLVTSRILMDFQASS